MPELKNNPELKDYQNYVAELDNERGIIQQTTIDKCLLLGEEVGELFKAIRKSEGLSVDSHSKITDIGDELTNLFIYLCTVANRKNTDMKTAFRLNEDKNKKRSWKSVSYE